MSKNFKKWKSKQFFTKSTALAMTGMMLLSPMASVHADDTLPYNGEAAKGENQPFQHGYRAEDILNWTPETDPYADMLRARVPLQSRNAAFADTQANPSLSAKPEYFTLTGDYGNAFFDSYPYTNEFSQHEFNFWQYVDYYGSWHGQASIDTPISQYDYEGERNGTSDWSKRFFEFGIINLPNPAYTNAAHKNGVKSIGCIMSPRAYENFEVMLEQDSNGNYPVAQKLVEMADYYGFDGWFFNLEGPYAGRRNDPEVARKLQEFIGQMKRGGMYVQWYDASASFSESTAKFLSSGEGQGADRAQSYFLDYGWYDLGSDSNKSILNKYGLDETTTLFGGIEAGGNKWNNNFDKFLGSDGKMAGSIASLGTDFVQTALRDSGLDITDDDKPGYPGEVDDYQWMAFERERMWWSGGNQDPTRPEPKDNPEAIVTGNRMQGVAKYIAERSVVNGSEFVTDFNTGHGMNYYKDGQISNEHEWSNINIQSTLPTWQWWFDGTEGLKADFDYGDELKKTMKDKSRGSWGYDQIGAYNGGSSLVIYGDTTPREGAANSFLHLYKTDLDLAANSDFDIVYNKTSDDAVSMKLGLIFKDDPSNVVAVDIPDTAAQTSGWVTKNVDLSAYAGKTVAAFGLIFEGTSAVYQMNVGRIRFNDGVDNKPAAPSGLKVSKVYGNTDETVLKWNLGNYNSVKQYNVYAEIGGQDVYMGGIFDDIYYIKDTYGAGNVKYKVKAVSNDGTESDAASVSVNYDSVPENIVVDNDTDGKLKVTWNGGQADVKVTTTREKTARTWSGSGNGECTITVPTGKDADGAPVSIEIKSASGTSYIDSRLPDKYCGPFNGKIWSNNELTQPTYTDWYKISTTELTANGEGRKEEYVRGKNSHGETNHDWAKFQAISGDALGVYVSMEDYSGNKSQTVFMPISDEVMVAITGFSGSDIYEDYELQLGADVYNASNKEVTWTVSGQDSDKTTIDKNGKLKVAKGETASEITVTATSKADASKKGQVKFNIQHAVEMSLAKNTVKVGETNKAAVKFKGQSATASDFTFSLKRADGVNRKLAAGTKVDADGNVTVDEKETAARIEVIATNKADTDFKGKAAFDYVGNLVYVVDVDPETKDAKRGDSIQFSASVDGFKPGDMTRDFKSAMEGASIVSAEGFSDYGWGGSKEDLISGALDKTVDSESETANIVFELSEATKIVKFETAAIAPESTWDTYSGPSEIELFYTEDGENWISAAKLENPVLNEDGTSKVIGTVLSEPVTAQKFKVEYQIPKYTPYPDWPQYTANGKATPIALYTEGWGADIKQDVEWSLEGNKSNSTSIDENGLLTIGTDEEKGAVLTVKAASKEYEDTVGTAIINVEKPEAAPGNGESGNGESGNGGSGSGSTGNTGNESIYYEGETEAEIAVDIRVPKIIGDIIKKAAAILNGTIKENGAVNKSDISVAIGSRVVIRSIGKVRNAQALNTYGQFVLNLVNKLSGQNVTIQKSMLMDIDASGYGRVKIFVGRQYKGKFAVVGHFTDNKWETQQIAVDAQGYIYPEFTSFSPVYVGVTTSETAVKDITITPVYTGQVAKAPKTSTMKGNYVPSIIFLLGFMGLLAAGIFATRKDR